MNRRFQSGFTLLELLVAMAMAIPVTLALITILLVTLHQTQRTFTEVSATQAARGGLALVENELHSACVGNNIDPVLPGSTSTSLQFLSYTGTDDSPTPVWHVLSLSGTTLTDTTYNAVVSTAGAANVGYVQGTKIATTTVLTNAGQLGSTPEFAYYAYQPYAVGSVYDWIIPDGTNLQPGTSATYPNSPLSVSGGLTTAAANSTVEVLVSLSVGASEHYYGAGSNAGTSDPVTDSISLRLTTPPNSTTSAGATGNYGPCA